MCPVGSSVYKASDLGCTARAVLDAAKQGLVRVDDTDGTSLFVVPEHRLETLNELVHWSIQHLVVEALLRKAASDRSAVDFGDEGWLQVFDDDDLATFADELGAELLVAAGARSTDSLRQLVADWRVTAGVLADPQGREILLGEYDEGDFVEVLRPE